MQYYSDITNVALDYPKLTAVALGMFDGVHTGHQRVIAKAVDLAHRSGGNSAVFTFCNHPLSVVRPEQCPPQISSFAQKKQLLQAQGIDVLIAIEFTPSFLRLSPDGFVDLLAAQLQPQHIVVGPNYSFGSQRTGNSRLLQLAGERLGFSVDIEPAVTNRETIVSSTLIRRFISNGQVREAGEFLGRRFALEGVVVHGDKRGRTLGFPTANLPIDAGRAAPPDGVYAAYIYLANGIRYQGVANVGANPTFQRQKRRLEVHLLNFSADIYGESLTVEFIERLRGEVKFTGAEQLKSQIDQDIQAAQAFF